VQNAAVKKWPSFPSSAPIRLLLFVHGTSTKKISNIATKTISYHSTQSTGFSYPGVEFQPLGAGCSVNKFRAAHFVKRIRL
jgi:hypothetical protein